MSIAGLQLTTKFNSKKPTSRLTAVQYAAKCGEKLIQAKATCAHGEWLPWLEVNCNLKERQARKYMRLAEEYPSLSNRHHGTDFDSIKTALAYLSASDEVKAEVDASTEPVTEKLINDLKKQNSEALEKAS